ncbi:hypothetical protein GCM10028773_08120 [Spirosoma koreense]
MVAGLLVLLPIVVFGYMWARYAVNVPKWDDHVLKNLLVQLDTEASVLGKAYQFFKQHNEHRIVYDRLITWLDFNLFGKLNYRHLMVVGNLSLVGLLLVFGRVFDRSLAVQDRAQSRPADGWLYLPPVAFLLFNLSQWENMFWGMAALQNFTVMLWVFWAIYLLAFTDKIVAALLVAIAATLTSGNGLLLWPVGFAMLLLQVVLKKPASRNHLMRWSSGAIGSFILYFWGYEKPAGNPPVRGTVVELLKGWLAFNGAAAEAFPGGTAFTKCLLLGSFISALVLGAGLYTLRKSLVTKKLSSFDHFFLGAALFLLGTAATVTWSRVGFGLNTLITSRYKFYSLLLLALGYSFVLIHTRASVRKWAFRGGLLFSVLLMAGSYRAYLDETIWWRQYLLTNLQFNWTYSTNRPVSAVDATTARLIDSAPAFYDSIVDTFYQLAEGTPAPLSSIGKTAGNFILADTASVNPQGPDAGNYLLLRSPKRLYLYPTTPHVNTAWKAGVGLAPLFRNGFTGSVPEADLDPGTYQIERVIIQPDGAINRIPTQQILTATAQVRRDFQKNW